MCGRPAHPAIFPITPPALGGRTPLRVCWFSRGTVGRRQWNWPDLVSERTAFVECAGKTRLPGFGFFWQGDLCALRGEDGSQRAERNARNQSMVAGYIYWRPAGI